MQCMLDGTLKFFNKNLKDLNILALKLSFLDPIYTIWQKIPDLSLIRNVLISGGFVLLSTLRDMNPTQNYHR